MSIEQALIFTLRSEGGYVNNPNDPGGATNHGVTQRTYSTYLHNKSLADRPVKDIEDFEIRDIYSSMYWIPGHCQELPTKLGVCHFDACVNTGYTQGIKLLQDALGITSDGIFGANTRLALETIPEDEVCAAYLDARRSFYRALAEKPKLAEFLNGWLKRCDLLQAYLAGI